MNINTRTEISSQPATTNQLPTPTARKPPDQLVLNYAGTRLPTGCFPQSPTSGFCCCAHSDLPFSAWNKLCGTSSLAEDRPLTNFAPTLSNYTRLVPYAVLHVPVLSDLQSNQLVSRNTAAKSPTSTKRHKSDRTGRQNCPLTSFSLGVDPSKPPAEPNQSNASETARNI